MRPFYWSGYCWRAGGGGTEEAGLQAPAAELPLAPGSSATERVGQRTHRRSSESPVSPPQLVPAGEANLRRRALTQDSLSVPSLSLRGRSAVTPWLLLDGALS